MLLTAESPLQVQLSIRVTATGVRLMAALYRFGVCPVMSSALFFTKVFYLPSRMLGISSNVRICFYFSDRRDRNCDRHCV